MHRMLRLTFTRYRACTVRPHRGVSRRGRALLFATSAAIEISGGPTDGGGDVLDTSPRLRPSPRVREHRPPRKTWRTSATAENWEVMWKHRMLHFYGYHGCPGFGYPMMREGTHFVPRPTSDSFDVSDFDTSAPNEFRMRIVYMPVRTLRTIGHWQRNPEEEHGTRAKVTKDPRC